MSIPREILLQTEKPGRYIGGEMNACVKAPPYQVRFGFCFPDIYEIGMSHLGLQILYFFINRRSDTYCERFFAPWTDMEGLMRKHGLLLTSLETGTPARDFDILGFTLQYELSYTNVLNMLNLAGVPLYSKERGDCFPLIIGGGPCTLNPEPLSDFFDLFYIGEGEAMLDACLDTYAAAKQQGLSKREIIRMLSELPGIYAPAYPTTAVARQYIKELENAFFPDRFIVPSVEAVHDRVSLELFRGCSRGCRFCHAGFTSRPVREKSVPTLLAEAETLIKNTGHGEISLVSLSTGDYSAFNELCAALCSRFTPLNVSLSLPSLRADKLSGEAARLGRSAGLTLAPEAGSDRMRNVINKGLTEDEILKSAATAFLAGASRVKLYFMAGLPCETDADLEQIPILCEKILDEFYKIPKSERANSVSITASGACFIPKPHTPFQWEAQSSAAEFFEKHKFIKSRFKKRQIKYSYHDCNAAVIEGALSRGDKHMCAVLHSAWRLGARFDGWSDKFDYSLWERAFDENGISPSDYTRARAAYEALPWEYIKTGVSREFLLKERERAYNGETTPVCKKGCKACGVCV